jgi:ATP-dependent Clp protease ATP-binding subunit ClpC
MYEEFSDDARAALELAKREANRLKDVHIGTEHLLLGLFQLATSKAREELNRSDALTAILRDVPLTAIQQELERIFLRTRSVVQHRSWLFWRKPNIVLLNTPRARKALEYPLEEAHFWHQNQVRSVHLLLGLLRDEDGLPAALLAKLRLDYQDFRRNAERLFQSER